MPNLRRVIFATIYLTCSVAVADLTEGGKYADITDLKHPLAKSLVAVNQLGMEQSHHGNGFFWGPNGCFVVTNFHVAFAKAKIDRKMDWIYPTRREFVQNAKRHRLNIRADLDPDTGEFRRNLEGRVIRYANYDRTTTNNSAGDDIAILKLYEPGTETPACVGQAFVPQLSLDHTVIADGFLPNLNVIHLFKTGANSARVFVNTTPCQSAPYLVPGGTAATCDLRDGASGSILFQTIDTRSVIVVGLSANHSTLSSAMSAANVGAINRNLKVALEDEGISPQIINAFFEWSANWRLERTPAPTKGAQ
mgnify:CR=1 FL=1